MKYVHFKSVCIIGSIGLSLQWTWGQILCWHVRL